MNNNTDGNIVFDFSGVIGITGIVFTIDPAWFDGAGDVMILMSGGYSLTIQNGMMGELVDKFGGMVVFSIKIGSVTVSVTQNGKEIGWYSYQYPMTVSMPFAYRNEYTVNGLTHRNRQRQTGTTRMEQQDAAVYISINGGVHYITNIQHTGIDNKVEGEHEQLLYLNSNRRRYL